MPVVLMNDNERMKWTHEGTGAGFIYRRIPNHVLRDIQAKYTERGVITNGDAVFMETLEWCILDWFGFVDHKGEPVIYNKSYLHQIPELMKVAFVDQLYALNPEIEQLGN